MTELFGLFLGIVAISIAVLNRHDVGALVFGAIGIAAIMLCVYRLVHKDDNRGGE